MSSGHSKQGLSSASISIHQSPQNNLSSNITTSLNEAKGGEFLKLFSLSVVQHRNSCTLNKAVLSVIQKLEIITWKEH